MTAVCMMSQSVSQSLSLVSLIVPEKLHQKTEPRRGLVWLRIRLLVQTQHVLANLQNTN